VVCLANGSAEERDGPPSSPGGNLALCDTLIDAVGHQANARRRRAIRWHPPKNCWSRSRTANRSIAFVEALADERAEASEFERADPQRYRLDGAHNWKNGSIDGFLYAALRYFEPGPYHQPKSKPSWRVFAEILWCGKIIVIVLEKSQMEAVWVFNGGGDFPAAVFSTREKAEAWIAPRAAVRRADQVPGGRAGLRMGHRQRGVHAQAAGPVGAAIHRSVQFGQPGTLPLYRRSTSLTHQGTHHDARPFPSLGCLNLPDGS